MLLNIINIIIDIIIIIIIIIDELPLDHTYHQHKFYTSLCISVYIQTHIG